MQTQNARTFATAKCVFATPGLLALIMRFEQGGFGATLHAIKLSTSAFSTLANLVEAGTASNLAHVVLLQLETQSLLLHSRTAVLISLAGVQLEFQGIALPVQTVQLLVDGHGHSNALAQHKLHLDQRLEVTTSSQPGSLFTVSTATGTRASHLAKVVHDLVRAHLPLSGVRVASTRRQLAQSSALSTVANESMTGPVHAPMRVTRIEALSEQTLARMQLGRQISSQFQVAWIAGNGLELVTSLDPAKSHALSKVDGPLGADSGQKHDQQEFHLGEGRKKLDQLKKTRR